MMRTQYHAEVIYCQMGLLNTETALTLHVLGSFSAESCVFSSSFYLKLSFSYTSGIPVSN